ncbi:MAG: tetratricopeptide repeat protein [Candidatus Dojkabacteria bacterium]|nr:tetratricopeptide repeat protein [Candidatus Dojkabacteria bacterium]
MKKKIIIIVSIVVGILLLAGGVFTYLYFRPPTEEEMTRYQETVSEGDLLFEGREYSEAINQYNEAIKIVHVDSDAYSKMIDIYILKNDFDTALEIAQKAQNNLTSADVSILYAKIADAYFKDEDYYNARINYEIAVSLNGNPTTNLGLAKSYVFSDKFDLAENLLKKEYDNETVDDAKILYVYILSTDNTDTAKEFINLYTPTDENKAIYFEEFSSVLNSLDEDELFNLTKLSRIYINNGYPSLAIKLLEPKGDEITQYVDALYYLGKAYLETKQYDKAVETLLKSTSLLGYESDKYWMLGRAYYYQDDMVNAVTYYDMAVGYAGEEITRDLVEEYLNILLDANQITKAQEVYSSLVKTIKKEWLYLIGLELYYSENDAKFNYYLSELADMDMDDSEKEEYLFWKIRKEIDDTDTDNIDQDFESLLALDRFNPKYYWMKGVYLLSMFDTESAKENFEIAMEYDTQGDVTKNVEDLLAQLE